MIDEIDPTFRQYRDFQQRAEKAEHELQLSRAEADTLRRQRDAQEHTLAILQSVLEEYKQSNDALEQRVADKTKCEEVIADKERVIERLYAERRDQNDMITRLDVRLNKALSESWFSHTVRAIDGLIP